MRMIINDAEWRDNDPDDGRLRLALMGGALAFAAVFGALYAELQALI